MCLFIFSKNNFELLFLPTWTLQKSLSSSVNDIKSFIKFFWNFCPNFGL